jgi:CheY-like chemotaxis protein
MAIINCRSGVARVLLADAELASRLALKTILSVAGYAVSGAASAAEAIGKLDKGEYELVLADLRGESEDAGPGVLAYARQKEFRPATALITSKMSEAMVSSDEEQSIHISNEDVFHLLDRVAALISQRAGRRAARKIGQSATVLLSWN